MSTKNFSATITTRYGEPEKDIYRQVIDLVKKNSIAKSRAQLLLVERGLQHTHNPELAKHLGQGIEEHITGNLQNAGQRASADKLTTRDKAGSPSSPALETKKSAKEENGISGWAIGGGLGLVGLLLYLIFR